MTNDQRDLPSGDGDRFGNTPTAKLVVFVALAAAALIFVLQNRERKSVDFLFLDTEHDRITMFSPFGDFPVYSHQYDRLDVPRRMDRVRAAAEDMVRFSRRPAAAPSRRSTVSPSAEGRAPRSALRATEAGKPD